jgi:hypothetical protein
MERLFILITVIMAVGSEIEAQDLRTKRCKDGKYGYVNAAGEEIFPCKYDRAENYGKGFIDKTDKKITPFIYDRAVLFEAGIINEVFEGRVIVKPLGKWIYIDKQGNEYAGVKTFSEGFAKVKLNGKYGFIDKAGKEK